VVAKRHRHYKRRRENSLSLPDSPVNWSLLNILLLFVISLLANTFSALRWDAEDYPVSVAVYNASALVSFSVALATH